jgi:hypothetical protein
MACGALKSRNEIPAATLATLVPMSDNWIVLIPEDPGQVPLRTRQQSALARFWEIAPDADEITTSESESLRFFDCGGNFSRVLCPACNREIAIEWWQREMDKGLGDPSLNMTKLH